MTQVSVIIPKVNEAPNLTAGEFGTRDEVQRLPTGKQASGICGAGVSPAAGTITVSVVLSCLNEGNTVGRCVEKARREHRRLIRSCARGTARDSMVTNANSREIIELIEGVSAVPLPRAFRHPLFLPG
jgi:hypothetical protein